MALSSNTPSSSRRNPSTAILPPEYDTHRRVAGSPSPTMHLDPEQYVGLLDFIEREGGLVTLDDVSRAFPAAESPVSAVFDLCDAGVLCADLAAAFGGDMLIWRKDG